MERTATSKGGRSTDSPFCASAMVLITMHSPREKFWGLLLELNQAGASVSGWSLESIDDCIRQLKNGERVDPTIVFFPMHRIERMELDTRNGDVPSLSEQFESQTGLKAAGFFNPAEARR